MNAKSAKKVSEQVKCVYAVCGTGGRVRDAALSKLREFVLQGCDRSMCLREFDGDEASISEVLDELRTLPFLGPRKMVEVHRAEQFIKEHRQALEEYLTTAAGSTGVLVFVLEKPLPGNQRLAKTINKLGKSYSTDPGKNQDVVYMLVRMAKDTYGKILKPDAAGALRELTGESLNVLAEELEKLCLYVGQRQTIAAEDVHELVGQNRELSAFEMTDALLKQDTAAAIQLMERILDQNRNAEYSIIGLLSWYVRRLRKAQALLSQGQSEAQICGQLRIWYGKAEFMRLVRRSSEKSLRLACKQLTQADRAIKTGFTDVKSAVEKFILSLTTASPVTG